MGGSQNVRLDLSKIPLVVGVLNLTPDSFFDGGKLYRKGKVDIGKAYKEAQRLIENGADVIEVGGESSRPGSSPVNTDEELERVLKVITLLSKDKNIPISIDTYKALVAEEALKAGACMVNDISSFSYDKEMVGVCRKYDASIVLMHSQSMPSSMVWSYEDNTVYNDLVNDIIDKLKKSILVAKENGVRNIIIDVGFGFGKSVRDNFFLLKNLKLFKSLNCPIMVGVSRKSFIGVAVSHSEDVASLEDRLYGTLAANMLALVNGADMLRVHDVKPTVDLVKVYNNCYARGV